MVGENIAKLNIKDRRYRALKMKYDSNVLFKKAESGAVGGADTSDQQTQSRQNESGLRLPYSQNTSHGLINKGKLRPKSAYGSSLHNPSTEMTIAIAMST